MKLDFLFGIHCHQPVENFKHIVENAVKKSYKPFFDVIKNYKDFKLAVHFSGWLLEYLKKYDKNLFKTIQHLSEIGVIEFFTGGYYEPILPSIPSDDRKLQIEKLNKFIKDNFRQEPKGLWLTERVWDSSIVKDLVEVGVEYVVVDDYHFLYTGFNKDDLYGYYITEEEGYSLKVFPIDKTLRYLIPFKPIKEVLDYLEKLLNTNNGNVGIIFDDGEKFGVWPGTYNWVYNKKWLSKFIDTLINNNKINILHFKEFVNLRKPKGITYLPTTSYFEMGRWSLPIDDYEEIEFLDKKLKEIGLDNYVEKYLKGGIWKNFFVKYPESNRIHKRMLELSKEKSFKKDKGYLEWILKSQFNDVLWHGIFGGLYLPNLRNNVYRFLIEAEKRKDTLSGVSEYIEVKDIDFDGYDEIKLSNEKLILIVSTKVGGQIIELSLKDKSFNLQNTLTRRKEIYHSKMLESIGYNKNKEKLTTIHENKIYISKSNLKKLVFDRYTKNSFIDHITDKSINLKNFYSCTFKEYGDFVDMPFNIVNLQKNEILLSRTGTVKTSNKFETTILKKYKVKEENIFFEIDINCSSPEELMYLLEFNFHFLDLDKVFLNGNKIKKVKRILEQDNFIIEDLGLGLSLKFLFEEKTNLLTYPLETVSQSESGISLITQGQTFGFIFPFKNTRLIKGCLSIEVKNV